MERFSEIFKHHPLWIILGVGAMVVFIWLFTRGKSSSNPTIVSYGPSDAVVQANAQKEMVTAQTNAATVQAQLNTDAAVKLASINAGAATGIAQASSAAAVTINQQNTKTSEDVALAQIAGTVGMHNQDLQTSLATQANQLASQLSYQRFYEAMVASYKPVPTNAGVLGFNSNGGVSVSTVAVNPDSLSQDQRATKA